MELERGVHGLAGMAYAIEATRPGPVAGPAKEPTEIQVLVAGVKASAHDTGGKDRDFELGSAALHQVAGLFMEDVRDRSGPIGQRDQVSAQRPPAAFGNPELFSRRAVIARVEPAKRRIVRGGLLALVEGPHVAIETALLDPVDPVGGGPVALLVAGEKSSIRIYAEAVRGAKTVGEDLCF